MELLPETKEEEALSPIEKEAVAEPSVVEESKPEVAPVTTAVVAEIKSEVEKEVVPPLAEKETKPEMTLPEPRPEIKAEVKPEIKTEVKPEIKAEVKKAVAVPEKKVDVKPEVAVPEKKTEVKKVEVERHASMPLKKTIPSYGKPTPSRRELLLPPPAKLVAPSMRNDHKGGFSWGGSNSYSNRHQPTSKQSSQEGGMDLPKLPNSYRFQEAATHAMRNHHGSMQNKAKDEPVKAQPVKKDKMAPSQIIKRIEKLKQEALALEANSGRKDKPVLGQPVRLGESTSDPTKLEKEKSGNAEPATVEDKPAVMVDIKLDDIKEETKPEETKPEETKPEETKPEETKPEETNPEETKPVVTQPEEKETKKEEEAKPEKAKDQMCNCCVIS